MSYGIGTGKANRLCRLFLYINIAMGGGSRCVSVTGDRFYLSSIQGFAEEQLKGQLKGQSVFVD